MTEFTSDIKSIPFNEADIYPVLSDMSRIQSLKDRIPENQLGKIKDMVCDKDSCTISVDPIGNIRFFIVERTPNSTIKFDADKLPFPFNLWVQLKQSGENDTKLKITVKADLNVFLKPMLSKPIQEGVNKMAEMLAALPYDKLTENTDFSQID